MIPLNDLPIRPFIVADDGHLLLCVDFSQIEYRLTNYLAGDLARVLALHNGEPVYQQLGAKVVGLPLDEVLAGGKKHPARQVGKQVALSGIYKVSYRGYMAMEERAGRKTSEADAVRAIEVFRAEHKPVVRFWDDTERAAMTTVKNRDEKNITGVWTRFGHGGCLAYSIQPPWLVLRLPSGRVLRYLDPKIERRPLPWDKQKLAPMLTTIRRNRFRPIWQREATYSGSLVENLVQAAARDLLARALMMLDAAGFDIRGHTHDEVILQVPVATAEADRDRAVVIMTKEASWLPGFPLGVEATLSERYA